MLVFCFGFLFALILVCEAEPVTTCTSEEFPCNDGSCIPKIRWCDSKLDCEDDSDENYCWPQFGLIKNPNRCNETSFFLCDDGPCIPAIGRCDGYSSCEDNSDEENCDSAENVSGVSTTSTTQAPIKITEGSYATSNRNDTNTFKSSYADDILMQADAVNSLKNITSTYLPVSESFNTSENSPSSFVSTEANHHNLLQTTLPSDVRNIVSENLTNQNSGINSRVLMSDKQAFKFHEVVRMLNASGSVQNMTSSPVKFDTLQDSVSFNKSSNQKPGDWINLDMASKISNNQTESNKLRILKEIPGDSPSQNIHDKEEDMEKGFVKLNTRDFRKYKDRALQWLTNSRDKDYGWGDETARGLTALYMTDYSAIKQGDKMLMTKQLHLKLFTSLNRNKTKRTSLSDFALYINALSASCENPKNFYGEDLVNILRQKTNVAQSSEFVPPFVYLVLCLNNESSHADVKKVNEMLLNSKIDKIDSEAIVSLAASCIVRNSKFSTPGIKRIAAKKLYYRTKTRGLPSNIYELSLLTQALNEARINQDLWNRTEAMRRITDLQESDGSFGDILSTYYAVPTLSGRSFLSVGQDCPNKDAGFIPVEVLKNGKDDKMFVDYALLFGDPLEMSQSLKIEVQKNTSFMDIMRIAATINPIYKFKYDVSDGKPSVYSIGGIANDAERGLYWVPYTSPNIFTSSKKLPYEKKMPFDGDIQSFIPAPGENVAFWMKSLF